MSLALRLARACRDAYSPDFDSVTVGNNLCTATITRRKSIIEIAFQGTNERADWFSNFDFTLVPHVNGWASRGFLESYKAVRNAILMAIMPDDDEALIFTGHSRGGPHAAICAEDCARMGLPVINLTTFASPRWCDATFAKHMAQILPNHDRFVYESDLVTRLPFCFGHTHTGNLQWFTGSSWRQTMPLHTRLGVYLFNRRWPFIGNNVADHSINHYITALESYPWNDQPPSSSPSPLLPSPSLWPAS